MAFCLVDQPGGASIPVPVVRPILAGIHALGGEITGLRARLGIGEHVPHDAHVAAERFRGVMEEAARALGPELPLLLARALPVGSFGFAEYSAMAAATLREGLARASRFIGLLSERVTLAVDENGAEAHLMVRLRWNAERIPHLVELLLATIFARAREAVGEAMALRRVGFATRAPAAPAAFTAHFRAPVVYEAPVDELVFDRALLDLPLRTADPATAAALGRHGGVLGADRKTRDPFVDDVRDAVRRAIERGDPRVGTVAARLRLSVRTLQRRLGELGVSYSALVDDVRRETALQLVGRRTTTELALMLGFTTPAAFYRAFRRWTGTTPRAHVAALRSGT